MTFPRTEGYFQSTSVKSAKSRGRIQHLKNKINRKCNQIYLIGHFGIKIFSPPSQSFSSLLLDFSIAIWVDIIFIITDFPNLPSPGTWTYGKHTNCIPTISFRLKATQVQCNPQTRWSCGWLSAAFLLGGGLLPVLWPHHCLTALPFSCTIASFYFYYLCIFCIFSANYSTRDQFLASQLQQLGNSWCNPSHLVNPIYLHCIPENLTLM